MDIRKVRLTNFMSHADTDIDFADGRPYLFVGENGGGKSSLVKDAITYALFGSARADGAGDDLIKNQPTQEKKMSVELVFVVNGSRYRIRRYRERNKKTELSLFRLDDSVEKDITNVTATATQADVLNILGFNQDVFELSACLEQGGKYNFSSLTPKQCKDTILAILNVDRYNVYEKAARTESTRLSVLGAHNEAAINDLVARIAKFRNTSAELATLAIRQTILKKEIGEAGLAIIDRKSAVEKEIADIEKLVNESMAKAEMLRSEYKSKESAMLTASAALMTAGQESLKLQNRMKKLGTLGHKCPTCESAIDQESINKITSDLKNDLATEEKNKDDASVKFNTLQEELREIETEGKALGIVEKQQRVKELSSELLRLAEDKTVAVKTAELAEVEKSIALMSADAKQRSDLEKEIAERRKELATIVAEQAKYDTLVTAFGKNGIPAMIVSNAVIELELDINKFLRELTTKSISVRIATEKNLKSSDELSDTLEIVIRNGMQERPYRLYSGGEKFRIDLAIRLALARILARRNNFKLDTLILDEPAFLDKSGLSSLKETLLELQKTFKKIFVISHLDELIEDNQNRFNIVGVHSSGGTSVVKRRM